MKKSQCVGIAKICQAYNEEAGPLVKPRCNRESDTYRESQERP